MLQPWRQGSELAYGTRNKLAWLTGPIGACSLGPVAGTFVRRLDHRDKATSTVASPMRELQGNLASKEVLVLLTMLRGWLGTEYAEKQGIRPCRTLATRYKVA